MIPLACGGRDAYLTPMNTTETPLFKLRTEYVPTGDQPAAIEQLASNIEAGVRDQVLLGVTGSGKTCFRCFWKWSGQMWLPRVITSGKKSLSA